MKFNQIKFFLAICETLNFTKAAELCYVSQPALSLAIKNLESELGGELFIRDGKQIQLSVLGLSMRTHLSKIQDAKNSAELVAQSLISNHSAIINLGLMCSLNTIELLSAIEMFTQKNKHIEILIHDIWESKALELLVSGVLDCVLLAHSQELPNIFVSHHLVDDSMVLAMSKNHALAERTSVSANELQQINYIDRLRCEYRAQIFKDMNSRNVKLNVIFRSEREDLIANAVEKNLGVTVMPNKMAKQQNLAVAQIEDVSITRKLSIVSLKETDSSLAISELMELTRDFYQRSSATKSGSYTQQAV